jgi:RND family efflux transporter MFP subunit
VNTKQIDTGKQPPGNGRLRIPAIIGGGSIALLLLGTSMVLRAESKVNQVALVSEPKLVSVIEATSVSFRSTRTYVGTIQPWTQASVGPQLVAGYVDTVLVRPGAVVEKGNVLATLDCRNASAASQAVAMQAHALEAQQQAIEHEASRVQGMLDGGFVSPNEAEQKTAQSQAQQAQLLATRAKLLGTSLEVNDCVLRAPFDGEIASRSIDPGAFVRPGTAIVSIVDRRVIRVVGDAPEIDFDAVAPDTKVTLSILSTKKELSASITRRAPAADLSTRTVHFEIDIKDPQRDIPVGTTAEIRLEVGEPVAATKVPVYAAAIRGTKAGVFVLEGNIARSRVVPVIGESAGTLFLNPLLLPGSRVVTEGRALLNDGDEVKVVAENAAKENKP